MIQIFDGAMGTMLQAGGLKAGACPELMNIELPEVVKNIHRAYIEAGSTIITTNTFGASRLKLSHYGLESRMAELNSAAVKIAKEVAAGRAKVAGDIGPTGRFIAPLGDLDFEEAYNGFYEQSKALAEAGADFIIIETCIDLQEMRAALLAAKDACNLPVICQFSYSEDGRTVTGTDPQSAAVLFEAMGAAVIGVNCSLGPEQLVPIVKELAENCTVPVSVQPNAGMPYLENGETKFPMDAVSFGKCAPKLLEAGATYLGGCCGTTPDHIRELTRVIRSVEGNIINTTRKSDNMLRLTSRSKTVTIDKSLPTVLIGERINPTGRKKLAAEIREGSLLSVKRDALKQIRSGATVLDVNMGVGGIDETAAMKRAVTEIAQLTEVPLAIDTGNVEALEAGLRAYPGRALINSVSAEPDRLEKFLPLAKKYGAAILCLPITDKGVPKTAEERVETVSKIIDEAKRQGLRDGDFLLDGLVMTISADANACHEVLKTLRMYRDRFGYPATMGLSNISFGLPNRPLINSTFFAMCLAAGLDAPIMNPYDELMQNALKASAALLGKDPNGLQFSKLGQINISMQVNQNDTNSKVRDLDPLNAIKQAVIEGEKDEIAELVSKAIEAGHDSNEITNKALTAAMNDIGVDFGAGKMFLPQVLLSAETMRAAFNKLKELLPAQETKQNGTVVIATVKGDVHDLGKNIVGALLSNSGFKLVDLGKDVESDKIVRAAIENKADIVGLCALMTTTMVQIDKVIADLHAAGCSAKVMVGGAALTQEYADSAGADAYAKDGVQAVQLAKQMLGIAEV
ncbi:MAG: homocysteine S-methyltransferase family protein [Selenomonadaceae bacterium]|nr:homocysteine S-methyltransferase family protein [Selenomonadaceae bacterium]